MLTIHQLRDIRDGAPLRGFIVRNKIGKCLALGATGDDGFVIMAAKRYANDRPLCEAIERLTGQAMRVRR